MARNTVLVIHNRYLEPGGEDEVVRAEIALLRQHGHRVLQYGRHNREIAGFGRWRRLALAATTTWDQESYAEVRALIRQDRPAIAHCHNLMPLLSPSVYYACAAEGVPVVQTVHNYRLVCPDGTLFRDGSPCADCRGSIGKAVLRGCYRGSHRQTASVALMLGTHRALGTWRNKVTTYIAPSEFCRSKLVQSGLAARDVTTKPHFAETTLPQKNGLGDYAIFVGRLSEQKGILPLLKLWRQLPDIPLVVVGSGPRANAARQLADDTRGCSVRFTGQLTRSEVLRWIHGARFLVAPSRCCETFGLAVLEAMCCGVPAIVPSEGAMRELVCQRRTGMVVDVSDPAQLSCAIRWAWSHPLETKEMGRAALYDCREHYSPEANYRKLMEIYAAAMLRGNAGVAPEPRAGLAGTVPVPSPSALPKTVNEGSV